MAEIRFPRRGRSTRSGADESAASPDPLREMEAQVRELDAAAERVAARISETAGRLRAGEADPAPGRNADLLAGLAAALVERSGEISADCGRLSALISRTAELLAPEAAAPAGSHPPPAAPRSDLGLADVAKRAPEQETSEQPAPPAEPGASDHPAEDLAEAPAEVASGAADPPQPIDNLARPRWLARRESEVPPKGTSEGVRLIATQMAIAGSSRGEIERRLRIQFGVRDADLALDEIFGHRSSEVS